MRTTPEDWIILAIVVGGTAALIVLWLLALALIRGHHRPTQRRPDGGYDWDGDTGQWRERRR